MKCLDCSEKAIYGIKQEKPTRCKNHKIKGMVTRPECYCIHNRYKNKCIECKGSGICEHNKIRSRCRDCKGGSICSHNKIRTECKYCKGGSICLHNKIRSRCRDCKGGSICLHNKIRSRCRDCKGGNICIHNKVKSICKECKGTCICKHNKIRSVCKECKGGSICEHNKVRTQCKLCNGGNICKHKKEKRDCIECGGNRLCKTEWCSVYGNKKYDSYCTHCFANIFPTDPRTAQIRKKSKEIKVVSYISSKFKGFVHDKPLYVDLEGGCCNSKIRIDLRKLINNTMLCIEIDENQHKGYNKRNELNRYDNLFMDFSGKYIFIRYNPDKYKINNKIKNPHFKTRINKLIQEIKNQMERINKEENTNLLEIIHLYYDE